MGMLDIIAQIKQRLYNGLNNLYNFLFVRNQEQAVYIWFLTEVKKHDGKIKEMYQALG